MTDWIWTSGTAMLMVLLTGLGIYISMIFFTRLVGLRSFSKMSSFDFAITVGIGTVLAGTLLNEKPPLLQGIVALAVLYGIQFFISYIRRHYQLARRIVDNEPLLIMAGEKVIEDHLDTAQLTRQDLHSKLRLAGITSFSEVWAVVLETTGEVAVLKKSEHVDAVMFSDIRGSELLE